MADRALHESAPERALRAMFGLLGEVLGKSSAAVAIFAAVFLPFLLMHAYMYTQKKERHKGVLTAAVMDQARRGKIGYISSHHTKLAKSVAERVARELLGAGCSLLELDLIGVSLNGTWVETFGEAAVCSEVLRELWLGKCKLRGPLPVMRLPALQLLNLTNNELTGHINPLQGCTALQRLDLSGNNLRGGLEGLKGCVALRVLHLNLNQLIGGLEPLEGCKALTHLWLHDNQLTGGLEPLKGCTALQDLRLSNNKFTGGLDALEGLAALKMLGLFDNKLKGGLEPLQGCKALEQLGLENNQLSGGLEPLAKCTALNQIALEANQLTGSLEPLMQLERLKQVEVKNNRNLWLANEDKAYFEKQCLLFSM